jgi:hypothetical protein
MIIVIIVGAVLGYIGITFGVGTLMREDDLTEGEAQARAWASIFWPVTVPVYVILLLVAGLCMGIAALGEFYVDYIRGGKKDDDTPKIIQKDGSYIDDGPGIFGIKLCGGG